MVKVTRVAGIPKVEKVVSLPKVVRMSRVPGWQRGLVVNPGGVVLNKTCYREALPRGPVPYPFINQFSKKGTPFIYLLLKKSTPFTYLLLFSLCCST